MLNNAHGTMSSGLIVGEKGSGKHFLGGVAADLKGLKFWPVRYNAQVDAAADVKMYKTLVADGAHVVSNSYGNEYVESQDRSQFSEGIQDLKTATFVFAAGNAGKNLGNPTHFKDVILVGSSIPGDKPSDEQKDDGSNFGKGIIVCVPGGCAKGDRPPTSTTNGSKYDTFGDTSAACAMVSGVICLMLLAKPTLTPAEIREHLCLTADKIDPGSKTWGSRPTGFTDGQLGALHTDLKAFRYSEYYGFGRVNAEAAVRSVLGL